MANAIRGISNSESKHARLIQTITKPDKFFFIVTSLYSKRQFLEIRFVMAALAQLAERAIVHVLLLVTFVAMPRNSVFVADFLDVAAQTISGFMRAAKFEAGLRVVIEVPRLPVLHEMTQFAPGAKSLLVPVVLAVACIALNSGLFEIATDMTGFAT